jgi:translation initiation factor IF-1
VKSGRVNLPEAGNFAQNQPRKVSGKIISVLAGTMFRVELPNERLVLAHISGKMRKRFIRLTTGDRVKLEMSPYDIDKARIVYRLG